MRKLFFCFVAFILYSSLAAAEWNDSIRYKGEAVVEIPMKAHTPFWLMNGKYGVSSLKGSNGYMRLSAFKDMDTSRRLSWGAGADVVIGYGMQSTFFLQQLYAEAKYRSLNLMIGAKEMPGFLSNPELASGNMLYANNAHPIPQIKLGIFDYADLKFTKGWVGIKGYLSYGIFTDNRWINNWVNKESQYTLSTLYHSKALFLRGGNAQKFPLEFEMGIEMATQFGGTTYYPDGEIVKMPRKLKNWIKAFIPMGGDADTPVSEQTNVEGNFIGTWNFALSWKPQSNWSVKAYYQHLFEDHSMLWFDYPWKDGLWGIEAKLPDNPFVSEIVYEYLYTKDQGGPVYWDQTPEVNEQVSGRDGYYNHYICNGWQNWGMGIGNPLFISPIYNNSHQLYFFGNRLWAHHLGFKGSPSKYVGYRILATYQKNWGTYDIPFPEVKSSFNLLTELNFKIPSLPGWQADIAFGMDAGSLVGNNYGMQIRISKTGWLFGKKSN